MSELEPRRVQKMPTGRKPGDPPSLTAAVRVVTHYWVSDRREMNANLMGSPGVQFRTQQLSRSKASKPHKIRGRPPAT